jgi:hypothetical protein
VFPRSAYPAEWELEIPTNTKLDELRKRLDERVDLLPRKDLEDRSPLPVWFRVYLRRRFPDLAKEGTYQYPRNAARILQRLIANPDSLSPDEFEEK